MPWLDLERAVLGTRVRILRRLDNEAAVEALRRTEPVFTYLMAHGARYAVGRLPSLFVVGGERQMREYLSAFAAQLRLVPRDRHVADRAVVLDRCRRFRVIDRLAPDACLPVRIARRIRHHAGAPVEPDRHVLARRRHQAVMAREAAVG